MHLAVVCRVSQIDTIFSDIFVTKETFGQCFSKKEPYFSCVFEIQNDCAAVSYSEFCNHIFSANVFCHKFLILRRKKGF